jgi:hypothetical protein
MLKRITATLVVSFSRGISVGRSAIGDDLDGDTAILRACIETPNAPT